MSKTLFRRWIQRETLKNLELANKPTKGSLPSDKALTSIKGDLYDKWLDFVNRYPENLSVKWVHGASEKDSPNAMVLKPFVLLEHNFRDLQKKNYTVERAHQGNSYVHCRVGGQNLFGSIQTIFVSDQIPGAIFLEVAIFVDIDKSIGAPDPFRHLANLHYRLLVRPNPPQTIVLRDKEVVGLIAVLTNPPGVFGIDITTLSVAIVHHMVRHCSFVFSLTSKASGSIL